MGQTPKEAQRILDADPELKLLYEEYCLCRQQDMIVFYKKLKDNKEQLVLFPWTTGFSCLPFEGGLRDQSFLVSKTFNGFLEGERRGQIRKMLRG